MSDRICIHRIKNVTEHTYVSAQHLMDCCKSCSNGDGCDNDGGFPGKAWNYYYNYGIASGGSFESNEGNLYSLNN